MSSMLDPTLSLTNLARSVTRVQSSHIHGGDLLSFGDLSLFLSQLVGRFVPFLESTRRPRLNNQASKTAIDHLREYAKV